MPHSITADWTLKLGNATQHRCRMGAKIGKCHTESLQSERKSLEMPHTIAAEIKLCLNWEMPQLGNATQHRYRVDAKIWKCHRDDQCGAGAKIGKCHEESLKSVRLNLEMPHSITAEWTLKLGNAT